jgi:Chalcone isomerase-like
MNQLQSLAASVVLGFACAAPIAPAWAAIGQPPPELEAALPQHRLLGKARLSVYGFQVYDSRLWVPPVFSTENFSNQPFALELAYLRDFKNEAIVDRSIAEIRRLAAIDEAKAIAWRQAMLRVIPNIKKGDRVMGVNRPGEGATFWVNGRLAGDVDDAEFARLFFGIWLSPKTSQPKMRIALLAGSP